MQRAKILLSISGLVCFVVGAFAIKNKHLFSGTLRCFTAGHVNRYNTLYTTTIRPSGVTLTCCINLFDETTYFVTVKA